MLKYFLILVLIYIGVKLTRNIRLIKKSLRQKGNTNLKNMDIQDAEFQEIDNE